jgi:hypothetical protein
MEKKESQVLKGNFVPRNPVVVGEEKESLTDQFEREALKRLGGSIAFVSKKNFIYGGHNESSEKTENSSLQDS